MQKYQRIRVIGKGSFGCAVLVKHKQTNKHFVVKEIVCVRALPLSTYFPLAIECWATLEKGAQRGYQRDPNLVAVAPP